jgi:hypothetical protein
VIAIGSLPLLLLELQREDLPSRDQTFLRVTNVLVLVAFAVDCLVEPALARRRWVFVRKEWMSLAIVFSQGLAVIPSLAGFGVLRVLRGARVFRLAALGLRAAAIGGSVALDGRRIVREHRGVGARHGRIDVADVGCDIHDRRGRRRRQAGGLIRRRIVVVGGHDDDGGLWRRLSGDHHGACDRSVDDGRRSDGVRASSPSSYSATVRRQDRQRDRIVRARRQRCGDDCQRRAVMR